MTLALGVRNSVDRRHRGCRGRDELQLVLARAVGDPEAQRGNSAAGSRVLFIGNSLTEANGLPAMVETLSRQGGGTPISTASVVFGGFSLEDHWNQGTAQRRIAEGGWSLVVLHQGPSALPESQVSTPRVDGAFRDAAIRAAGARTALYMVWPESNRRDAFDAVSRSYARAAEDVTGMLLPVGEAWRAAWRRDPAAPLLQTDGFHPTTTATYLAALVVFEQISGQSPMGLPAWTDMSADRARLLQEAAQEANAQIRSTLSAGVSRI